MSVKKTTTSKQTNNHICSGGLEPKYKLNLHETIFQSTIFELMMIIVFRSILLDYLKYQFGVST